MARSVAEERALLLDQMHDPVAPSRGARAITVSVAHRLDEVEAVWRGLTASGVESPGQNIDFIRLWAEALRVAESDQFYLVATLDGAPLALVPLQRRWDKGVRVLSWFPGPHVGCNAPIVDAVRLRALSSDERRRLWTTLLRSVEGADVVYLKAVPELIVDGVDLFGELGQMLPADELYRASFSSFEEADRTQRNKSRRKHDRQQGERLTALGEVNFETLGNSAMAVEVLDTMFRQRAARFRQMGVFDPFALPVIRRFYDSTAAAGSRLPVMLHVLRLDGAIVAVRYSIVHGERLFCLISSMSDAVAIQAGSPGKQCLLRVMQSVFAAGYRMFDMGAGLTDEKRHWCNQQIPLRHHYMPITRRGALAASAHRGWHKVRRRIKHDARLLGWAKGVRSGWLRLKGQGKVAEVEE